MHGKNLAILWSSWRRGRNGARKLQLPPTRVEERQPSFAATTDAASARRATCCLAHLLRCRFGLLLLLPPFSTLSHYIWNLYSIELLGRIENWIFPNVSNKDVFNMRAFYHKIKSSLQTSCINNLAVKSKYIIVIYLKPNSEIRN